jgi:hypothetical protein
MKSALVGRSQRASRRRLRHRGRGRRRRDATIAEWSPRTKSANQRKMFVDRIVEMELTFLDKHQNA